MLGISDFKHLTFAQIRMFLKRIKNKNDIERAQQEANRRHPEQVGGRASPDLRIRTVRQ